MHWTSLVQMVILYAYTAHNYKHLYIENIYMYIHMEVKWLIYTRAGIWQNVHVQSSFCFHTWYWKLLYNNKNCFLLCGVTWYAICSNICSKHKNNKCLWKIVQKICRIIVILHLLMWVYVTVLSKLYGMLSMIYLFNKFLGIIYVLIIDLER